MLLNLSIDDLSDLPRIDAALKRNDPRGQFADLGMGEVQVAKDVQPILCEVIARYLLAAGRGSKGAKLSVVSDPIRIMRDGGDLKNQVASLLSQNHDVRIVELDDGADVLHADEPILAKAAQSVSGADCIVSIGSGTLTDIAKVAAHRSDVPVHVAIQTAASVDGFTDNFSVVLQNGVKKTLLSRWPDALLCDVRTIAQAPRKLTAAGLAEMMSMFCAPGDWYLAAQLGVDDTFTPVLLELLSICGSGIEDWSKGLASGDLDDCESLTKALALRGIVTGVGGTTATLSGMEHLFSHMLDMVASERHTRMGLHGAQVGVGAIIRAAAWEEFCARMAEAPFDPATRQIDISAEQIQVKAAFAALDPTGAIGEECAARFTTKLEKLQAHWTDVTAFFADWSEQKKAHDALVFDAQKIADYLHRAKAPMRFDELEPASDFDLVHWVTSNAQFMRERLTVADLLYLAGWLDADGVARILARVDAVIAQAKRG